MGEFVSSDKNWLIKSSTRIIGPFTLDEVTNLLKSKQVSIIDEIRLPAGRWSYIRENHVFMDIVKNIREEIDASSENTMTHSVAQHTMTKTDTMTQSLLEETTKTPLPPPQQKPAQSEFKDVTQATERSRSVSTATTRSYGSTNDARIKNRIDRQSSVWRWIMMGLIAVCAVALFFGWSMRDHKKNLGYDELLSKAIRYKSLGLYDLSLQAYKKAAALREPDLDSQTQMASVLISEDHQSLQGRHILERSLMQDGRSRADLVDAYLGIAVSYMMDGDLKQASDTLEKVIGYEPFNSSAMLNLAIVQLKKGNYQEALHGFEEIYRKDSTSVLALFGRAMSSMELAKQNNDFRMTDLVNDVKQSQKRTGFLHQEFNLFLVYAASLANDVDGLNQAVVQFLNDAPGRAERYTHPLTVDWRYTQWDYLEKYCSELYEKSAQTAEMKALRAVCLSEVNRDPEAQTLLKEALSEGPKDPYVLAAQAGSLVKVNRVPEAMVILKMPELSSLSVRQHLMGDACIATQDANCAQSAYTEAFQANNKDVEALYGLAWVVLKNKDRGRAYDYVRAGLQAEPNYLPLLELRDKLESE